MSICPEHILASYPCPFPPTENNKFQAGSHSALFLFIPSPAQGLAYSRAVVNDGCNKCIGMITTVTFCLLLGLLEPADPLCFLHSFIESCIHSHMRMYMCYMLLPERWFKGQGVEI